MFSISLIIAFTSSLASSFTPLEENSLFVSFLSLSAILYRPACSLSQSFAGKNYLRLRSSIFVAGRLTKTFLQAKTFAKKMLTPF
jgi:hypothetical protein